MTLRAFTAVSIADDVRTRLGGAQTELRRTQVHVKWVRPENLHLTLAFLGEIEEAIVDPLCDALGAAVASLESFSFEVTGLGCFGRPGAPRVVWAGVRGGHDALRRLSTAVTGALSLLGCPFDDKPFAPHLTLGRVRATRGTEALEKRIDRNRETAFGAVHVENVVLVKSDLRPTGPVYSVVRRLPLQTPTATAGQSPFGERSPRAGGESFSSSAS